eukprot:g3959.t1
MEDSGLGHNPALEGGDLNISFEELSKMQANGELDEFLEIVDKEEEGKGEESTLAAFEREEMAKERSRPLANCIFVGNLPKIDQSKYSKLHAIVKKLFDAFCRDLDKDRDVYMPFDEETKKTKGFAFIQLSSPEEVARAAMDAPKEKGGKGGRNGFALDKNHKLRVIPYEEVKRISTLPETYTPPAEIPYTEEEDLYAWLQDDYFRDNYVLRYGNKTEIYWSVKNITHTETDQRELDYDGRREINDKVRSWCDKYVAWSPEGTYFVTIHSKGIKLWGGPNWKAIRRIPHPGVWKILFSPNEKYILTWNGETNPKVKNSICVFDVRSGKPIRKFAYPGGDVQWPFFVWSHDDRFLASHHSEHSDNICVYDAERGFGLHDLRWLKAPNYREFSWSPGGSNGEAVIAMWTPESNNSPAVVKLVAFPSRKEIRSQNLFKVADCKMIWQARGQFFCVQVARLSKSKKTTNYDFQLYRMADRSIPIESLKMKDHVHSFEWAPSGVRFAILHGAEASLQRTNVSFYSMDAVKGGKTLNLLYTLENIQARRCFWSPTGMHCLLSNFENIAGHLEFVDVENQTSMASAEHFMCNTVAWDPSGRMVCTAVCQPIMMGNNASSVRYDGENGYCLWTYQGTQLKKEQLGEFYQFLWRPRPPLLLTDEKTSEIKSKLGEYVKKFDEEDRKRQDEELASLRKEKAVAMMNWRARSEIREKQVQAWIAARKAKGLPASNLLDMDTVDDDEYDIVEEIVEDIIKVEEEFI